MEEKPKVERFLFLDEMPETKKLFFDDEIDEDGEALAKFEYSDIKQKRNRLLQ